MRIWLLGTAVAASAFPAVPAAAQFVSAPGAYSAPGTYPGSGRDDRRGRTTVVLGYGFGGEWARYNNRSFEPDSYNDWWHDRTDRSYPRWMQNNGNCERRWWGGGTWRC
jgi:hypothetical protein